MTTTDNAIVRNDYVGLHPDFLPRLLRLESLIADRDIAVVRFETLRSYSRQQQLHDRGDSDASPLMAPHVAGCAADFVLDVKRVPVGQRPHGGKMYDDPWSRTTASARATWREFGAAAKDAGLVWGGLWPSTKRYGTTNRGLDQWGFGWDLSHVELPGWRKALK